MDIFATLLIIVGATLMVYNIIRYANFLNKTKEVFSGRHKTELVLGITGLVLLIFFLLGYLFVGFFVDPNILVALILFFGSVYVSINESITFKLFDSSKEKAEDTAEILIGIIDARGPNVRDHSLHVQRLTMLLYDHLPKQMRKEIDPTGLEFASMIHDVGKIDVPKAILNKPEKLTDEEWEVMKKHPETAVQMLEHRPSFEEIRDWVKYHHERPDGNGYYGIAPEDIPLPAKMIAIADTYSAITSERSYRSSKTYEGAIEIIRNAAGTQLDEQLVKIFLSIPKGEVESTRP